MYDWGMQYFQPRGAPMKWAFVYLVITAFGMLVWAIRFAIQQNKLDKTREPLDYPDWVHEQKRRRAYLDKGDAEQPTEKKRGRTHD